MPLMLQFHRNCVCNSFSDNSGAVKSIQIDILIESFLFQAVLLHKDFINKFNANSFRVNHCLQLYH